MSCQPLTFQHANLSLLCNPYQVSLPANVLFYRGTADDGKPKTVTSFLLCLDLCHSLLTLSHDLFLKQCSFGSYMIVQPDSLR